MGSSGRTARTSVLTVCSTLSLQAMLQCSLAMEPTVHREAIFAWLTSLHVPRVNHNLACQPQSEEAPASCGAAARHL